MNEEIEEQVRRVTVSIPMHPVEEENKPSVVRKVLVAAGVVAILAIVAWALLTREDTGSKSVSPALIGLWTSSHAEYSDRTLVLKSDSITFGTGGSNSVLYSIIGVVEQEEDDHTKYYVVHFRGVDGAKFRREIVLVDNGQSLFFRSQPDVVWTRFRR